MTEKIIANLLSDRRGCRIAVNCNCRMLPEIPEMEIISTLSFPLLSQVDHCKVLNWVRETLPLVKPGGFFVVNKSEFYAVKHIS